jgi:hypothetical protein
MQIIAIVESDDAGSAVVLDPEFISIIKYDNFYIAATRCLHTLMPITCEISEEDALRLISKGVKCIELESFTK